MLRLAILFAVIAMIAAGLGFYGLSDVSASFAKFFALIFAVLFVVALLAGAPSSVDQARSSDAHQPEKIRAFRVRQSDRPFSGPVGIADPFSLLSAGFAPSGRARTRDHDFESGARGVSRPGRGRLRGRDRRGACPGRKRWAARADGR